MNQLIQDPENPNVYFIGSAAEERLGMQVGHATLVNVHDQARCAGRPCVVHNPSDHEMRSWPLNWRGDRGLMERICPHGVGHPDPDDLAFHIRNGNTWQGVHGCDFCCCPQLREG